MDGEDSIDEILGDLGQLGDLEDFKDDGSMVDEDDVEILLIGRQSIRGQFEQALDGQSFSFYFVADLETAANLLIQHFFSIILLDYGSSMDLPTVSNLLRKNHALARIVLIYEGDDYHEITELYNDGSFDSIITLPTSQDEIVKKILQQEAQYAIQKEVTSFVSEPPKMSKASFLLLDPSLTFGDEDAPLNFVGVMIVRNTVPKYNIFFEDTLQNDEVLFAAFLSSITSLGDELFQSKQSLKEINFGGISVIFRFRDNIQISFLVQNLTRHNFDNAEKRIDNVMDKIFPEFEKVLQSEGMSQHEQEVLNDIFTKFDKLDEEEIEEYQAKQSAQEKRDLGTQIVILLASPPTILDDLSSYLIENSKLVEENYEIKPVSTIEETSELIVNNNVAVVVLDESALNQDQLHNSGLFIMESIEELDPSVQIIYFSSDDELDPFEIELLNSGNVDYSHVRQDNKFKIFASIQQALKESRKIKKNKAAGISTSDKAGLSAAKAMLKDNLEAFDSEDKPALQGIVIAQNKGTSIDPIFSKFYEVDGEVINFNVEMMAGLVTSLKQISGEMFTGGQQSIDGLDLAGHDVFVRSNSDFLFLYFVKNISANTSILIAKELDAVTMLFSEIIAESLGVFSAADLQPIFSKITRKTHENLTGLLEEHEEKTL